MTDPTLLDDAELDRLLGNAQTPPISADFTDRVLAEALREDRGASLPPLPPRPRAARRPWARRGMWAGVIAINLIVASAIAATITGVTPRLAHVVAVAAQVLHIHRHEAPRSPRSVRHPQRMAATPRPAPMMPLARPAPFVRPALPERPMGVHPAWHAPLRAGMAAHRRDRAAHRALASHHGPRRQSASARERPFAHHPGPRQGSLARPRDRMAAQGFDRPGWGDGMRRPWARGWREQGEPGMGPWRQRGADGWRRGGGNRGMGWRRPFGRGRRF